MYFAVNDLPLLQKYAFYYTQGLKKYKYFDKIIFNNCVACIYKNLIITRVKAFTNKQFYLFTKGALATKYVILIKVDFSSCLTFLEM